MSPLLPSNTAVHGPIDGKFGAMMDVSLTNEVSIAINPVLRLLIHTQGPVTFTLDTRKFEYIGAAGDNNGNRKGGKVMLPGSSTITPESAL